MLIVEKNYGKYLQAAFDMTKDAGLEKGTPVIDLTGQSPGILYAIGAKSVGQAWLIGGYPGSSKFAEESLIRASCEDLARAWVLFESKGPRSIPESVIRIFGAELSRDFKPVASWNTSPGAGGYTEVREQYLFKPIRPIEVARSVCDNRRRLKPSE